MTLSLPRAVVDGVFAGLEHAVAAPPTPPARQPVHVVYGGAHLFRAGTARKLGDLALQHLATYAPTGADLAAALGIASEGADDLHARITEKLRREPVEDLRVDFEDGYGARSDAEEDGHAAAAGEEAAKGLAGGTLPPFFGIRIKALDRAGRERAVRTLDGFFTALCGASGGRVPPGIVVTLPKIVAPEQVGALAALLDALEGRLGLPAGAIGVELMIETPEAVLGPRGEAALPALVAAGRGRVTAAHFGAYDYTAALGVTARDQHLAHPHCDLARQITALAAAGTGVRVSDGATTVLPVELHRPAKGTELTPAQRDENRRGVHRAWALHHEAVRRALAQGIYQGWDLHPAQLPARYAAVFAFFREDLPATAERLRAFVAGAARATQTGGVFDDAATGQGLLNHFLRALAAGAVTEEEVTRLTQLSADQLRTRSFAAIARG